MHITVPISAITQYDAKYDAKCEFFCFVVNSKTLYFMYIGILLLTAQPGRWDLLALLLLFSVVAAHQSLLFISEIKHFYGHFYKQQPNLQNPSSMHSWIPNMLQHESMV